MVAKIKLVVPLGVVASHSDAKTLFVWVNKGVLGSYS